MIMMMSIKKPIETRFSASNRVADISISPLRVALERDSGYFSLHLERLGIILQRSPTGVAENG